MFLCILVLRRILVLERHDGARDEGGLPLTSSCVGQFGLGSGLLGQLIFESALERQMVGSELREVALERRDRRFRARPGFGVSAFSRNLQDHFGSGNLFGRVGAPWQLADGSVGRDGARRGSVGRSRL